MSGSLSNTTYMGRVQVDNNNNKKKAHSTVSKNGLMLGAGRFDSIGRYDIQRRRARVFGMAQPRSRALLSHNLRAFLTPFTALRRGPLLCLFFFFSPSVASTVADPGAAVTCS